MYIVPNRLCTYGLFISSSCGFLYRFSPETASRRGLSTAEINAVEAIHRAVEFNPHVPKVRNFITQILLFKFNKFMTIDQNVWFVIHYVRIISVYSICQHLKRDINKTFRNS